MGTLIEDLGADYVDQFYRSAYFEHNDRVHMYLGTDGEGNISTYSARLDGEVPGRWTPTKLPAEVLANMDVFGWPKLGYRNYVTAGFNVPWFLSTARSAMRGLKDEFLVFEHPEIVNHIVYGLGLDQPRSVEATRQIYRPTYPTFDEAVKNIRDGSAVGYALSSDMALILSLSPDTADGIDVVFRQRVVGQVLRNNEVLIPHKYAKRASSAKLFGDNLR